ncbi:hypothetical protein N7492_000882 [Penicillium capsulatum]|uniref:Uncharacterized protein n=1 Tax=Penicillium capsulatum TaxID=69766 RepID=A0A9W9LYY4_9EURO|nr:hypothetical protein N7492_000882 [Penicillium capsulatum]KAJ6130062.1 hypothetical protein N7512_002842 [Penicillium capsulatum]
MSRAFSTATRQLKKLIWNNNGTNVDVGWAERYAETAVDITPGLADRVDTGSVQGNPHPTPKTNDPLHASVTFSKGKARVVSAHIYPDGGVVFSKDFAKVKIARNPQAPEGNSPDK